MTAQCLSTSDRGFHYNSAAKVNKRPTKVVRNHLGTSSFSLEKPTVC